MGDIRKDLVWSHKEIWDRALPYQDKRNDKGHMEIATRYAIELIRLMPESNSRVIIPAIILHDIGWSQMPYERRMISYNPPNKEISYIVRLEHQTYALELASKILKEVDYDLSLIGEILVIISQHDTRKGFYTLNDAVVRDADKLWRYTQRHMGVSIVNKNWTTKKDAEKLIEYLRKRINEPGFLLTEEAKKIARRDIKKLAIPRNLE